MSSDIIFYHNPMSRGQIIRWMLEEVGAPYDTEILDYASSMKSDEYRAINPMMKVPAITHNGQVVTEGGGDLRLSRRCVSRSRPRPARGREGRLLPLDVLRRRPARAGGDQQGRGLQGQATEQQRMFGYGNYDLAVNTLADHLAGRDYVCGSRFTAADVYVGSAVMWGTQFGTLPKLDSFPAYADRLSQREAYKRGKDEDNQLIAEMQAAG